MRRLTLFTACIMAASTIALVPQPAFACSCAPPGSDLEAMQGSDAVFAGTVMSASDPQGDGRIVSSGRPIFYTFEVDAVAKGDVDDRQQVRSAADGASCGFGFREGRRYLVFAYHGRGEADPDEPLHTDLCTKTRGIARGAELPLAARDVSGDRDAPGPPVDYGSGTLIAALAALAVLMVGAGYLLFRRIRA